MTDVHDLPVPIFMKLTHGSGTEGVEMKKAPTTEVMRALVLAGF